MLWLPWESSPFILHGMEHITEAGCVTTKSVRPYCPSWDLACAYFKGFNVCCIHRRQLSSNFWFLRFCCVRQWCHGGQLDVSNNDSFNQSHVHLLRNLWFVQGFQP